MLEGITVLSKHTVSSLSSGIAIIVLGAVGVLICALLCIWSLTERDYGMCFAPLVMCIICLVGLIYGATLCTEKPEVEYKVTIDDTVNFKKFNDRYTIIDQDGEIYTITEKESK